MMIIIKSQCSLPLLDGFGYQSLLASRSFPAGLLTIKQQAVDAIPGRGKLARAIEVVRCSPGLAAELIADGGRLVDVARSRRERGESVYDTRIYVPAPSAHR